MMVRKPLRARRVPPPIVYTADQQRAAFIEAMRSVAARNEVLVARGVNSVDDRKFSLGYDECLKDLTSEIAARLPQP